MKFFIKTTVFFLLTQPLFAQTSPDEQAIHQVVQTMADGWTEASGEKFASVFAPEHDYIVWNGFFFKGMNTEANARAHDGIFNTQYKDTDAHFTVDQIKFIREDLALAHVFGAIVPKGEGRPADPQVLWSSLLEKQGGNWKIISFHNLDLEVFQNEQMQQQAPMPPQVMYAGWYNQK